MKKHPSPIRITDAEWDVLTAIWKRNPIAASEIQASLSSARKWSSGTVRTLLTRLQKKGTIAAEKVSRRFLYTPLVDKSECIQHESRSFIEKFLGGKPSSIVLDIVRESNLSDSDIKELRKILREKEK